MDFERKDGRYRRLYLMYAETPASGYPLTMRQRRKAQTLILGRPSDHIETC
jgi:hypothetical protein